MIYSWNGKGPFCGSYAHFYKNSYFVFFPKYNYLIKKYALFPVLIVGPVVNAITKTNGGKSHFKCCVTQRF